VDPKPGVCAVVSPLLTAAEPAAACPIAI